MKLPSEVWGMLDIAEQKALATAGTDGINVVPVSMVLRDGDNIVIGDCFMDKTKENVRLDPRAALAIWRGFSGMQIKGTIVYERGGECHDKFVTWLKEKHPDRTLRGVLVMTPEKVYDLDPGNAGKPIC